MNKGGGNKNGTQLIRPKQQTKNQQTKQNKKQQKPREQRCPRKGGVKIGESKVDQSKWKCQTCRRLNEIYIHECTFCGDPKFEKEEMQQDEERPFMADKEKNQ